MFCISVLREVRFLVMLLFFPFQMEIYENECLSCGVVLMNTRRWHNWFS